MAVMRPDPGPPSERKPPSFGELPMGDLGPVLLSEDSGEAADLVWEGEDVFLSQSDPAAWQRFVARFAPVVARWARQGGLQQADIDDVVQETFVAVAQHVHEFRSDRPGAFRAWLQTITRNTMISRLRRLHRERAGTGQLATEDEDGPSVPSAEPEPLEALIARENRESLKQSIDTVLQREGEPLKTIVEMHLAGASVEEISEHVGLKRSMIYRYLSNFKSAMRREWPGAERPI